jgi:hypothetical protein
MRLLCALVSLTDILKNWDACENYICKRPVTWSELILCLDQNCIHLLGRMPDTINQYDQHILDVQRTYTSISDYIKHKYLSKHFICKKGIDGKIKCYSYEESQKQLQQNSQHKKQHQHQHHNAHNIDTNVSDTQLLESILPHVALSPNAFPYAFTDDIEHSVIWSCRELSHHEIELLVEYYRPCSQYHTRYYVNPPSLQSVKDVFHVQLFSKQK